MTPRNGRRDWSAEIFLVLLSAATVCGLVLLLTGDDLDGGLLWATGVTWLLFGPFFLRDLSRWLRAGRPPKRRRGGRRSEWVDRYGDQHQYERAKYADQLRAHGGQCMERVCVMPSRRIGPGAFWHLAHDHLSDDPFAYLGPAHPQCNEAEARARGVTWEGMGDHPEARANPRQGRAKTGRDDGPEDRLGPA